MGSTYVSGYSASAFRVREGYAFVTQEETCESNVHPQYPTWSPRSIGTASELAGRIVQHAYCCDGGMTRGPRGRWIRAEHFIECSEAAIRSADLLDWQITITFGHYLYDVPIGLLQPFEQLALACGVTDIASKDLVGSDGRCTRTLDLKNPLHGEVLLQFNRKHPREALAWRLFTCLPRTHSICAEGQPWAAFFPNEQDLRREAAAARDYLSAYRIVKLHSGRRPSEAHEAVVDVAGHLVSSAPLAWFCGDYLKRRNEACPGSSKRVLAAFRSWERQQDCSADISTMPAVARLLNPTGAENYVRRVAEELAGDQPVDEAFEVRDRDVLLCRLDCAARHFTVLLPSLAARSGSFALL